MLVILGQICGHSWSPLVKSCTLFLEGHSFFLSNHAPLCRWATKTVPLGAPNYGQANIVPLGALFRYPFFLSVLSPAYQTQC